MNLNNLAIEITKAEGLKKSVNIGQVKEILRLVFKKLKNATMKDVAETISRVK